MRIFKAKVTRIVDGDSVEFDFTEKPSIALQKRIFKKRTIRLFGMDAPESKFEGQSQGDIAVKARKRLEGLLSVGDEIKILTAVDISDRHGRVLGRVFKGGRDINLRMVRDGWAVMYQIYPNLQGLEEYREAFIQAMSKRRGMFRSEKVEFPFEFRARIRKAPPTRYVGDYTRGYYFYPNEYPLVKPEDRIFFSAEGEVKKAGFVLRPRGKVADFYK